MSHCQVTTASRWSMWTTVAPYPLSMSVTAPAACCSSPDPASSHMPRRFARITPGWFAVCTTAAEDAMAAKRAVLAFSGGLDTSAVLTWMIRELGWEVVTFTGNLGQRETDSLRVAEEKSRLLGAVAHES